MCMRHSLRCWSAVGPIRHRVKSSSVEACRQYAASKHHALPRSSQLPVWLIGGLSVPGICGVWSLWRRVLVVVRYDSNVSIQHQRIRYDDVWGYLACTRDRTQYLKIWSVRRLTYCLCRARRYRPSWFLAAAAASSIHPFWCPMTNLAGRW